MTGSGPTSNRFNSALEEMRSVPRYTVPVTMPRTLSHWSTLLLIAFSCGNGHARAFRFVAPARRALGLAEQGDEISRKAARTYAQVKREARRIRGEERVGSEHKIRDRPEFAWTWPSV
jgi:hypothetical protein